MNIEQKQTKGCDKLSRVYSDMLNVLQEVMHDDNKLKELSPIDYSALGIYMGKFVEQEINSSVVQLMRAFCEIDMPEYYCKRCPESDIYADVRYKKSIIKLNEQKVFNDQFSLKSIPLGDAYHAFLQLRDEDGGEDFFKEYKWLSDSNFLEAWRNLFRLRNKMAHTGEIIDKDTLMKTYSFFQRFLSYMPHIIELKRDLAPDGYYESQFEPIEKKKQKEEKPYWVSTDHRDKPYAPLEIAERFCELRDWNYEAPDFYERMDEKNVIAEKYYLDAMIFEGKNGKKGLKDCLGNILVPTRYDGFYFLPKILEHHTESVIAIRNGKYVVTTLDGSGTELTNREYDEIRLARNDHPYISYIYRKDKALSWGFMTNKGVELTDCIIDSYGLGLNSFRYESGGLQGYWQYGYKVLPPIYDNIEMVDGFDDPLVFTLNGEPGYVRHDGSFLPLSEFKKMEEEDEDNIIWDFFCEQYDIE